MKIGIIGLGFRIGEMLKTIKKLELNIDVVAVADLDINKAKRFLEENDLLLNNTVFYEDYEELLKNEKLDGIMIGTRCSLHTPIACKVLEYDIPLFLEKPVSINMEQLYKLNNSAKGKEDKVVVSFPLRLSHICKKVKEIIDSGVVGEIAQVQAYNNVPYGGVYFHDWYRNEEETGGLFMQKATHDLDYITYILGKNPVEICSMTSKQYFKGNKRENLKCIECEDYKTCIESPYFITNYAKDVVRGEYCCFAKDTGNEDSGSSIIRYDNGMHVVYTQNFYIKKSAQLRGARFLGTKGTVEFDWYSGAIKLYMHHIDCITTYNFTIEEGGHFGGDEALALDFMSVIEGNPANSNLRDGINSALMCLKAKESAVTHTFKKIKL